LEEARAVAGQVQLMKGADLSDDGFLCLAMSSRARCTVFDERSWIEIVIQFEENVVVGSR
jgi:hypothetical protein